MGHGLYDVIRGAVNCAPLSTCSLFLSFLHLLPLSLSLSLSVPADMNSVLN